jgi:hypothetical protein
MVEGGVQLVDGMGAEGISDLGSVESNPHHTGVPGPVVGDVGEFESADHFPSGSVEYLRNHETRA